MILIAFSGNHLVCTCTYMWILNLVFNYSRKAHDMFNASVRPSVCLSVCLKPKFGQLFDLSCLNLRGSAERTCNKKTKFGPTFYVLYIKRKLGGKNTVPRYTFASYWDRNWPSEAMFTYRHFSQAIPILGGRCLTSVLRKCAQMF